MLFSRRHPDGSEGKIYQSIDGGPASLVAGGPHSSVFAQSPEHHPRRARRIFYDFYCYGTLGGPDLYYSTWSSTSEPFGFRRFTCEELSSAGFDARPFVSWDGTFLTFSSARAGNPSPLRDIWFSTRSERRPAIDECAPGQWAYIPGRNL